MLQQRKSEKVTTGDSGTGRCQYWPFPLRRQGFVAFLAVWTQDASESRECGKVCEITEGLGCLSRYRGRAGLPILLPETQGWVAFPAVWTQGCVEELRAEDMELL